MKSVEPYACSVPARDGGRIFINTGELYTCESVDEIAGVFAHEIAHILARHIPERRASEAFARSIAQVFGWNAALGSDLISWRVRRSFRLKIYFICCFVGIQLTGCRLKNEKQTILASC